MIAHAKKQGKAPDESTSHWKISIKNGTKRESKKFANKRTIRGCNTKANLANGICNPESKSKFSVAIFLKKKVDQPKKKLTNHIRAVSPLSYV